MSGAHPAPSVDRLAAVLRSDDGAVGHLSLEPASSLLEAAEHHGVQCLLGRALRNQKARREVSEELATALDGLLCREQGVELVRRGELRRVIEGFDVACIPALLFKGAALAYTHYPFPDLRPRCDTDLLVRSDDRARAAETLTRLGYDRVNAVERDAIFTQWMFQKPGTGRVVHTVDLHWRISNRPLFRDILSFDELHANAVEIAAIGQGARTPGAVHSLLLSCIHPIAHHHCEWSLIWLYDILLLGQDLDVQAWREFVDLAAVKKVSYVCREVFRLVFQYFGTPTWLDTSGILETPGQRRLEEPSAAYLGDNPNARRDLILDLNATIGFWAKSRFLAAHSFPDARYIRAAYGASGPLSIAAAYGRRMFNAGRQLIRASHTRPPRVGPIRAGRAHMDPDPDNVLSSESRDYS